MIADELAQEVDFFSLGTSDLTQYTPAIDRQNSKLDTFYPHSRENPGLSAVNVTLTSEVQVGNESARRRRT